MIQFLSLLSLMINGENAVKTVFITGLNRLSPELIILYKFPVV